MNRMQWLGGVVAACLLLGGSGVSANLIIENFSYGDTQQDLNSLGSVGDGWDGAWRVTDDRAFYAPSSNLTYTAVGFNNAWNPSGEFGVARDSGGPSGVAATVNRPLEQVLDGTVWISALIRPNGASSDDENHAVVWAGSAKTTSDLSSMGAGLAGDGENVYVRYNPVTVEGDKLDSQGNAILRGNVNLLLMRITVNYNAEDHDRLEVWYNPDLTGGLVALGAPKVLQEGEDVLGAGINRIGVGFRQFKGEDTFAEIDFIRASNADGEQGFLNVTAIPEPGSFSLLLLSSSLIWLFRRRLG